MKLVSLNVYLIIKEARKISARSIMGVPLKLSTQLLLKITY
jgi:hypothetical protein